ncbi:MAG TPA: hypothetical protein VJ724_07030, partial [Tahibacter sp.]|nr:hypothetical protein [Tahibacter sp.]
DIARQLEHAQTVPVTIARETVLAWSTARDVERLGALCRLLQAPNVAIEPPLSFDEYAGIVLPYLRRCIHEDPRGAWAESREAAAATFRHWFAWLWRHRGTWPNELVALKHWLRGTVAAADDATRACLVAQVLEPLFDDAAIARFFADWRVLPDTARAYADAFRWREKLRLIGVA